MRIAFLTCSFFPALTADDRLTVAPLARRGAQVDPRVWDDGASWDAYDMVVVRTPWDYQERPAEFLGVLDRIHASGVRLVNDLELLRWNLDKRYLRELEHHGVPIVETAWRDGLGPGDLEEIARTFNGTRFVIKPVVGASAHDAYRLDAASAADRDAEITQRFAGRPLMVQPYMERIVGEGEYSVMAFAGEPSHAALKRPGAGDYRVQEEHGGSLRAVPLDDALSEAARRALAPLARPPVYARIDLVRDYEGELRLMELELVEPDLFLRLDEEAAERFAAAIVGPS